MYLQSLMREDLGSLPQGMDASTLPSRLAEVWQGAVIGEGNMSEKVLPEVPQGAGGEEILRALLPLVVEAVTKSAEGQTASAASLHSLEGQITELRTVIQGHTAEIKRVNDYRKSELRQQEERSRWLESLLTPQTLYYTLLLLGAAFGLRATIPAPVQVPPLGVELPSPFLGDAP